MSAQEAGVLAVLLPYLAATVADRAVVSGDLVSIWVRAAADGAACPGCGTWCVKVRGRYWRRLRDTAAGGRRVLIWLLVRLLRCGNGIEHLQCAVANFFVDRQIIVPWRTKGIEHARWQQRFHAVRNIAGEIKGIAR